MTRTGTPLYKPAAPRRETGYSDSALRKRAKSLARNLLRGMPGWRGGTTGTTEEWGADDVVRFYDDAVPYRWARAAIRLRTKYRLYYGPAWLEPPSRAAHGAPGTTEAERDYAAAILRLLRSDTPEATAEWIAGEARTENRAGADPYRLMAPMVEGRPPRQVNVLDQLGGFTAVTGVTKRYLSLHKGDEAAATMRASTLWRPGHVLTKTTIGNLVASDPRSFYQRNHDVTKAIYKLKGYRYPVAVWFDNATGERIA